MLNFRRSLCEHGAGLGGLFGRPGRSRLVRRLRRGAFTGVSGHPLVNEALQRLRRPPPGSAQPTTLLDVGCSDGEITRGLARIDGVSKVIGLDVDSKIIAQAKALATASPGLAQHVEFVEGSATDVEFFRRLAGSIHYLTCFTTLHWLKKPAYAQELAVVNFARALEPNGQLFILHFLGLDDSFMELEAAVAKKYLQHEFQNATYTPAFSGLEAERRLAQFKGLFAAVGLATEELRIVNDLFPIAKDQFLLFLQGASAHIAGLPDGMRQRYLEEWRDEILRQGKVVVKPSSYEFSTVAISAILHKEHAAPGHFYDYLLRKCEEGILRFEELENFGQDVGAR